MGDYSPERFSNNSCNPSVHEAYNAVYDDVYDESGVCTFMNSLNACKHSDPTCSGTLAQVEITDLDAVPVVVIGNRSFNQPLSMDGQGVQARAEGHGQRSREGEEGAQGFFQSLVSNAMDQALKGDVQKILNGLGSAEFADRQAFQKQAEALPVAALKHLRAGLTSENPEVRWRTADAIRKINNQNLKRCHGPMKAAADGFSDLLNNIDSSEATRKKFEDQLKLVDSLNFSKEELEAAYKHFNMPDEKDPDYLRKLLERAPLAQDPERMKAQVRLWYAAWLSETGSPQDKERAHTLLREAVRSNKWQHDPRMLVGVVDTLGGPEKMPEEVKTAYEASKKLVVRFRERGPSQPEPETPMGRRSDPNSTTGEKRQ